MATFDLAPENKKELEALFEVWLQELKVYLQTVVVSLNSTKEIERALEKLFILNVKKSNNLDEALAIMDIDIDIPESQWDRITFLREFHALYLRDESFKFMERVVSKLKFLGSKSIKD